MAKVWSSEHKTKTLVAHLKIAHCNNIIVSKLYSGSNKSLITFIHAGLTSTGMAHFPLSAYKGALIIVLPLITNLTLKLAF